MSVPSTSQPRGDAIQPPVRWVIFRLFPLLVLSCFTFRGIEDAFFEPRTVLDGVIVSKSYQPGIFGGGMMAFSFAERPYNFSIPASRRNKSPDGTYRFDSESSAVFEGLRARVTVLSRDLAGTKDSGRAATRIPALRIEQQDTEVFERRIAILWQPLIALLVMVGYLSFAHRPTKEQWRGVISALWMALDRRAWQVGQILHPTIAIGPPVRRDQHERFFVLIRRSILITVFMAFGLVTLLLFWGISYFYYTTLY